jgi:hypothetical protein
MPSPALVVSILALVVALGGTAYAVTSINGRQIARHSIPGNRLVAHTIGAAQVNKKSLGTVQAATNATELGGQPASAYLRSTSTAANASTLGGVPASGFLPAGGTAANAAELGGIGAGGFVQGSAHVVDGGATTPVSEAACSETAPRAIVATIPGYGTIDGFCAHYNGGLPICQYDFNNSSGQTLTGLDQLTIGSEGLKLSEPRMSYASVASGAAISESTNLNLESTLLQLGAGSLHMTALLSESHVAKSATQCQFEAEVTSAG